MTLLNVEQQTINSDGFPSINICNMISKPRIVAHAWTAQYFYEAKTEMKMVIAVMDKNNNTFRSELDWLVTYQPPTPENPHPDWKKCKLLGSLLDTACDINRRKGLTLTSMKAFDSTYKSKRIGTDLKVRNFNTFSGSIFLYNSELWTLTETQQNEIDSFHRRLLRRVINIQWPRKISNEDL